MVHTRVMIAHMFCFVKVGGMAFCSCVFIRTIDQLKWLIREIKSLCKADREWPDPLLGLTHSTSDHHKNLKTVTAIRIVLYVAADLAP